MTKRAQREDVRSERGTKRAEHFKKDTSVVSHTNLSARLDKRLPLSECFSI
jgi:hypothetical protein